MWFDGLKRALKKAMVHEIYCTRTHWGALPALHSTPHLPKKITIHHTATPSFDTLDMSARMRQMQSYHMRTKGWADIGYHFCVGQDGIVYEGRPANVVGAHVGGFNTGNIGISFIGNYEDQEVPENMVKTGIRLLRAICNLYDISPETIKAHKDYHKNETCPGKYLYKIIPEMRSKI